VTENPGIPLTILAFLLVIGPLVFVHELGHYFVARWFGVKIEAFSIGFGREIKGWTDKRGTRWKLAWLPLGGYVRFAGDMNAVSQPSPDWLALPPQERARTFQAKPVWQRALIVFAGPAINFLFAFLILMGFALAYGESRTLPVAEQVVAGSAAEKGGMVTGDKVIAIDGRSMAVFDDVAGYVRMRPNEHMAVQVEREGAIRTLDIVASVRFEEDRFGNRHALGQLGIINARPVIEPVSLIEAPGVAILRIKSILTMMVDGIGQIITGRRSVKELGGPLKIAQASGEMASIGPETFIWFVALISINLGFINLLPVPMLDGGHLLFYAIEAVRRKPVGAVAQEWAFRSGMLALLALMMFVTFNDLSSFGVWESLSRLIG
jgi:regulator of sigma E protease